MKKQIKDIIYHQPFTFLYCAPDKLNQSIKNHIGNRHGKKYTKNAKEITAEDSLAKCLSIEVRNGIAERFIWIHEGEKGNSFICSLAHELIHYVDHVSNFVDIKDSTEARAYYLEYLLEQILKAMK